MTNTTNTTKAALRKELEKKNVVLSNNQFKTLKKAELQLMLAKAIAEGKEEMGIDGDIALEDAIDQVATVSVPTVPVGDLPMTKDTVPVIEEKKSLIGTSPAFVESKAIEILKKRGFTTVKHQDFIKISACTRNYYGTHYPGKVNVYHVRPLMYKGILCVLMILQEVGGNRYCAMGGNLKCENGRYSVTNIKTVKC